jgi:arsenite methyltransferase
MEHRAEHPSSDVLQPVEFGSGDTADLYDELPVWSAPFGLLALDRIPLGRHLAILDVGCGTGYLAIEPAERCGPGSTVYAVDPWHAATQRLARKVAQRGLSNVVILEQDASTLDLQSDSIDIVVSNLGVNNFDNPTLVLETCARVAKPGATFVLTTNVVGHMREFYNIYRGVLARLERLDLVDALDRHIAHRATVDGLRDLLVTAGFDVTHVETGEFRWRFADGSALLRHYFIRLGFVAGWQSFLRTEDIPVVFDALERDLNEHARAHGELALTIPMVCVTAVRTG